MTQLRFFTDEGVYGAVAEQLRRAGVDALSTPEAGRRGESDPAQLLRPVQQGRVLVTFNVAAFARLHHEMMTRGEHHTGLVVGQQRAVGDTIRRSLPLAQ